jgi:formylmethanofuran dehydrogenase subunit A
MPLPPPRVRVHIVCKDVTEGPQTMRPEEIEVVTADGRIVNDMDLNDFPRSIIEDIEEAIIAAGFRSGVIGAKVTVSRTTDRGKGITVVRARLRYSSNGRSA